MTRLFPPFLLLLISVCFVPPSAPAAEEAPFAAAEPRVHVLPGEKASFDCAKAKSTDEQIICSDHDLAQLDRRMGEIYTATRAALPPAEKNALTQAQRKWLAGHDQACGINAQGPLPDHAVECFAKRYQTRTAELQAWLTRGNVIRELGGNEPWAEYANPKDGEDHHRTMLQSCVGEEAEVDTCCVPGSESLEGEKSSYTSYVINGRRYILFTARYELVFHPPHGAYIKDPDDDSEGYGRAPEVAPTPGSCSVVFAEKAPGSGDFDEAGYRADGVLSMAELLSGKDADAKFVGELHARLAPGDAITLAPRNGKPSRYQWNAAAKAYAESR